MSDTRVSSPRLSASRSGLTTPSSLPAPTGIGTVDVGLTRSLVGRWWQWIQEKAATAVVADVIKFVRNQHHRTTKDKVKVQFDQHVADDRSKLTAIPQRLLCCLTRFILHHNVEYVTLNRRRLMELAGAWKELEAHLETGSVENGSNLSRSSSTIAEDADRRKIEEATVLLKAVFALTERWKVFHGPTTAAGPVMDTLGEMFLGLGDIQSSVPWLPMPFVAFHESVVWPMEKVRGWRVDRMPCCCRTGKDDNDKWVPTPHSQGLTVVFDVIVEVGNVAITPPTVPELLTSPLPMAEVLCVDCNAAGDDPVTLTVYNIRTQSVRYVWLDSTCLMDNCQLVWCDFTPSRTKKYRDPRDAWIVLPEEEEYQWEEKEDSQAFVASSPSFSVEHRGLAKADENVFIVGLWSASFSSCPMQLMMAGDSLETRLSALQAAAHSSSEPFPPPKLKSCCSRHQESGMVCAEESAYAPVVVLAVDTTTNTFVEFIVTLEELLNLKMEPCTIPPPVSTALVDFSCGKSSRKQGSIDHGVLSLARPLAREVGSANSSVLRLGRFDGRKFSYRPCRSGDEFVEYTLFEKSSTAKIRRETSLLMREVISHTMCIVEVIEPEKGAPRFFVLATRDLQRSRRASSDRAEMEVSAHRLLTSNSFNAVSVFQQDRVGGSLVTVTGASHDQQVYVEMTGTGRVMANVLPDQIPAGSRRKIIGASSFTPMTWPDRDAGYRVPFRLGLLLWLLHEHSTGLFHGVAYQVILNLATEVFAPSFTPLLQYVEVLHDVANTSKSSKRASATWCAVFLRTILTKDVLFLLSAVDSMSEDDVCAKATTAWSIALPTIGSYGHCATPFEAVGRAMLGDEGSNPLPWALVTSKRFGEVLGRLAQVFKGVLHSPFTTACFTWLIRHGYLDRSGYPVHADTMGASVLNDPSLPELLDFRYVAARGDQLEYVQTLPPLSSMHVHTKELMLWHALRGCAIRKYFGVDPKTDTWESLPSAGVYDHQRHIHDANFPVIENPIESPQTLRAQKSSFMEIAPARRRFTDSEAPNVEKHNRVATFILDDDRETAERTGTPSLWGFPSAAQPSLHGLDIRKGRYPESFSLDYAPSAEELEFLLRCLPSATETPRWINSLVKALEEHGRYDLIAYVLDNPAIDLKAVLLSNQPLRHIPHCARIGDLILEFSSLLGSISIDKFNETIDDVWLPCDVVSPEKHPLRFPLHYFLALSQSRPVSRSDFTLDGRKYWDQPKPKRGSLSDSIRLPHLGHLSLELRKCELFWAGKLEGQQQTKRMRWLWSPQEGSNVLKLHWVSIGAFNTRRTNYSSVPIEGERDGTFDFPLSEENDNPSTILGLDEWRMTSVASYCFRYVYPSEKGEDLENLSFTTQGSDESRIEKPTEAIRRTGGFAIFEISRNEGTAGKRRLVAVYQAERLESVLCQGIQFGRPTLLSVREAPGGPGAEYAIRHPIPHYPSVWLNADRLAPSGGFAIKVCTMPDEPWHCYAQTSDTYYVGFPLKPKSSPTWSTVTLDLCRSIVKRLNETAHDPVWPHVYTSSPHGLRDVFPSLFNNQLCLRSTPLQLAVRLQCHEVVKEMLDHPACHLIWQKPSLTEGVRSDLAASNALLMETIRLLSVDALTLRALPQPESQGGSIHPPVLLHKVGAKALQELKGQLFVRAVNDGEGEDFGLPTVSWSPNRGGPGNGYEEEESANVFGSKPVHAIVGDPILLASTWEGSNLILVLPTLAEVKGDPLHSIISVFHGTKPAEIKISFDSDGEIIDVLILRPEHSANPFTDYDRMKHRELMQRRLRLKFTGPGVDDVEAVYIRNTEDLPVTVTYRVDRSHEQAIDDSEYFSFVRPTKDLASHGFTIAAAAFERGAFIYLDHYFRLIAVYTLSKDARLEITESTPITFGPAQQGFELLEPLRCDDHLPLHSLENPPGKQAGALKWDFLPPNPDQPFTIPGGAFAIDYGGDGIEQLRIAHPFQPEVRKWSLGHAVRPQSEDVFPPVPVATRVKVAEVIIEACVSAGVFDRFGLFSSNGKIDVTAFVLLLQYNMTEPVVKCIDHVAAQVFRHTARSLSGHIIECAANAVDLEICRAIIEQKGFDSSWQHDYGLSPSHWATLTANSGLREKLLALEKAEGVSDHWHRTRKLFRTPLHYACYTGQVSSVNEFFKGKDAAMVERMCGENERSSSGEGDSTALHGATPLHIAALLGPVYGRAVVKALIENHGADGGVECDTGGAKGITAYEIGLVRHHVRCLRPEITFEKDEQFHLDFVNQLYECEGAKHKIRVMAWKRLGLYLTASVLFTTLIFLHFYTTVGGVSDYYATQALTEHFGAPNDPTVDTAVEYASKALTAVAGLDEHLISLGFVPAGAAFLHLKSRVLRSISPLSGLQFGLQVNVSHTDDSVLVGVQPTFDTERSTVMIPLVLGNISSAIESLAFNEDHNRFVLDTTIHLYHAVAQRLFVVHNTFQFLKSGGTLSGTEIVPIPTHSFHHRHQATPARQALWWLSNIGLILSGILSCAYGVAGPLMRWLVRGDPPTVGQRWPRAFSLIAAFSPMVGIIPMSICYGNLFNNFGDLVATLSDWNIFPPTVGQAMSCAPMRYVDLHEAVDLGGWVLYYRRAAGTVAFLSTSVIMYSMVYIPGLGPSLALFRVFAKAKVLVFFIISLMIAISFAAFWFMSYGAGMTMAYTVRLAFLTAFSSVVNAGWEADGPEAQTIGSTIYFILLFFFSFYIVYGLSIIVWVVVNNEYDNDAEKATAWWLRMVEGHLLDKLLVPSSGGPRSEDVMIREESQTKAT